MAFPKTLQDPSWYLDSGASNYIVTELGKMSLKGKYSTAKHTVVGNGSKLPITGIGTLHIKTLTRNLLLNDVLIVPLIKRNLLSMS